MIDRIYIPTYKRLQNQITLNSLHNKDNVWLVVRPEEEELAREIHSNVLVYDGQPGICGKRDFICKHAKGLRIMMMDDDVVPSYFYKQEDKIWAKWKKNTEEQEKQMFAYVSNLMDNGYAHGGFWVPGVGPRSYSDIVEKPYIENTRYYTAAWYDLSVIDPDTLDWFKCSVGEDFSIALQIHLKGYPSAVLRNWAMAASASHSKGGCSEWRTAEVHNNGQKELEAAFPDYVITKESKKVLDGVNLLNVKIDFKKAYKDGMKMASRNLESFFT